MTISDTGVGFPTVVLWMSCGACGGRVAMFNQSVRPTEALALLKCDECGAEWELPLHLRPHVREASERRQRYREGQMEKRHRAMTAR